MAPQRILSFRGWRDARQRLTDEHQAAAGQPRIVVLVAPAGAGKTRLLQRMAALLGGRGAVTWWRQPPYPPPRSGPLLIDDAAQLDDARLAALLADPPGFVLMAARPEALERIAGLNQSTVLVPLNPMTLPEMRVVMQAVCADAGGAFESWPPGQAEQLAERCGGWIGPLIALTEAALAAPAPMIDAAPGEAAAAAPAAAAAVAAEPAAAEPAAAVPVAAVPVAAEFTLPEAVPVEPATAALRVEEPAAPVALARMTPMHPGSGAGDAVTVSGPLLVPAGPRQAGATWRVPALIGVALVLAIAGGAWLLNPGLPALHRAPSVVSIPIAPARLASVGPAAPLAVASLAVVPVHARPAAPAIAPRAAIAPATLPPNAPPQVELVFRPGDAAAEQTAARLARVLGERRIAVAGPVAAGSAADRALPPGIRYFFAEDRPGALAVQAALGAEAPPVLADDAAKHLPGTIQIVIGPAVVAGPVVSNR